MNIDGRTLVDGRGRMDGMGWMDGIGQTDVDGHRIERTATTSITTLQSDPHPQTL